MRSVHIQQDLYEKLESQIPLTLSTEGIVSLYLFFFVTLFYFHKLNVQYTLILLFDLGIMRLMIVIIYELLHLIWGL